MSNKEIEIKNPKICTNCKDFSDCKNMISAFGIPEDVDDDCCNCRINKKICDGNGHFGLFGEIDVNSYIYHRTVQGNEDFIEKLKRDVNSVLEALKAEYEKLKS